MRKEERDGDIEGEGGVSRDRPVGRRRGATRHVSERRGALAIGQRGALRTVTDSTKNKDIPFNKE